MMGHMWCEVGWASVGMGCSQGGKTQGYRDMQSRGPGFGVYIPSHSDGEALETQRHDDHVCNLRNETKTRDKETLNYRGEVGMWVGDAGDGDEMCTCHDEHQPGDGRRG